MSASLYFQCLLGIRCNDFAIIAADQTNIQSVIVMKNDENKLHDISEKLVMGVIGSAGDAVQFVQFISKNLQLYKMKNSYQLDPPAAVHFIRKNLTEGLREGNPSVVNMLICGYSEPGGGHLYAIDFLASCVKVPFAVHGFGGMLSLSILDRFYKPTLTEAEAYEILKLCVQEVQQRLFVNLPNFQVKVVSKDGIKVLPTINMSTLLHTP